MYTNQMSPLYSNLHVVISLKLKVTVLTMSYSAQYHTALPVLLKLISFCSHSCLTLLWPSCHLSHILYILLPRIFFSYIAVQFTHYLISFISFLKCHFICEVFPVLKFQFQSCPPLLMLFFSRVLSTFWNVTCFILFTTCLYY